MKIFLSNISEIFCLSYFRRIIAFITFNIYKLSEIMIWFTAKISFKGNFSNLHSCHQVVNIIKLLKKKHYLKIKRILFQFKYQYFFILICYFGKKNMRMDGNSESTDAIPFSLKFCACKCYFIFLEKPRCNFKNTKTVCVYVCARKLRGNSTLKH